MRFIFHTVHTPGEECSVFSRACTHSFHVFRSFANYFISSNFFLFNFISFDTLLTIMLFWFILIMCSSQLNCIIYMFNAVKYLSYTPMFVSTPFDLFQLYSFFISIALVFFCVARFHLPMLLLVLLPYCIFSVSKYPEYLFFFYYSFI